MIDAMYRLVYRCAYPIMRVYWRVLDPVRRGTLVAVWYRGRILLIKNSYTDYYCVPGGYAKSGETPEAAVTRELREEVDLRIDPSALRLRSDLTREYEGRNNQLSLFELEVTSEPRVQVDRREVVSAELVEPEEALRRNLFPVLYPLIRERSTKARN